MSKPVACCAFLLAFAGLVVVAGCQLIDTNALRKNSSPENLEWKQAGTIEYPDVPCWHMEFTPDGKTLVTADDDLRSYYLSLGIREQRMATPGRIRVWQMPASFDFWPKNTLNIHYNGGFGMGRRAFINSVQNTIVSRSTGGYGVWNLKTGELIRSIESPDDAKTGGVVSSDRNFVAWVTRDSDLLLHDLNTGTSRRSHCPSLAGKWLFAFSPDDRLLVASGEVRHNNDGYARELVVIDRQSSVMVSRLAGSGKSILDVRFSPNGKLLTGWDWHDGVVYLWDVNSGRQVARFNPKGVVWSVVFSPDNRLVAVGSETGKHQPGAVHVYDVETQQLRAHWTTNSKDVWGVTALAFSPDGTTLAVGRSDGRITFRSVPDIESETD